jgi:hypothetical protein
MYYWFFLVEFIEFAVKHQFIIVGHCPHSYYFFVSGDGSDFWGVSCITACISRPYGSFVRGVLIWLS